MILFHNLEVCLVAHTYSVDLPQNCTFRKEHGLVGVYQDQVKVGLPGPVRCSRLQEQHKHEEKFRIMLCLNKMSRRS